VTSFCHVSSDILFLINEDNRLYFATVDAVLHCAKAQPPASTIEYAIPFGIGASRSVAVYGKLEYFVLTSPSEDAFHAFSMQSTLKHVMSVRQQFSGVSALLGGGARLLIVLNSDASLAAWDLTRTDHHSPLYRVNYHLQRAVDAAASESLQMVVSCDITGKVALMDLYHGTLMRSFNVPLKPVKVMLLDEGFVVLLCEEKSNGSTIQIYELSTDLAGTFDSSAKATAWCGINPVGRSPMIAVAFDDGLVVLLGAPEGNLLTSMKMASPVVAMTYEVRGNLLFIANQDRQVLFTPVDF
jgi:hypothetical protein